MRSRNRLRRRPKPSTTPQKAARHSTEKKIPATRGGTSFFGKSSWNLRVHLKRDCQNECRKQTRRGDLQGSTRAKNLFWRLKCNRMVEHWNVGRGVDLVETRSMVGTRK